MPGKPPLPKVWGPQPVFPPQNLANLSWGQKEMDPENWPLKCPWAKGLFPRKGPTPTGPRTRPKNPKLNHLSGPKEFGARESNNRGALGPNTPVEWTVTGVALRYAFSQRYPEASFCLSGVLCQASKKDRPYFRRRVYLLRHLLPLVDSCFTGSALLNH